MSVLDRVFFTWPVVVLRLGVVAMVNRSRVGALAMALWWSRAGQERRRCLWTAFSYLLFHLVHPHPTRHLCPTLGPLAIACP
jgi:hypothetical protein